jgi:exodeoxyribonuclease VII small subunit
MSEQPTTSPLEDGMSYDDAILELQGILAQMQGSNLGIDELAAKLQRAGALLDHCQGKLKKTEAEVQAVLERLGLESAD